MGSSWRYHFRASASVWASYRSMSTAEASAGRETEGTLSLWFFPSGTELRALPPLSSFLQAWGLISLPLPPSPQWGSAQFHCHHSPSKYSCPNFH